MVSYISQTCNKTIKIRQTCNKTIKIRQTCSETKKEGAERREERVKRREKIRERRDETWAFIYFSLICGMGGSTLRVFFT